MGIRRLLRDQRGFTLIELLMASTIFTIVLISATGAFVSVSRSSTKVSAQRTVQQDARFNLEEVQRAVRSSQIDYGFYEKAVTENQVACQIGANNRSTVLALLMTESDAVTRRVIFFYRQASGIGSLVKYTDNNLSVTPACAPVLAATNVVTNARLNVSSLQFTITPSQSPLKTTTMTHLRKIHPRVATVMTVATQNAPGTNQARRGAVTVGTTASTRSYALNQVYGQTVAAGVPGLPTWTATGWPADSCVPLSTSACAQSGSSLFSLGIFEANYTAVVTPGSYNFVINYRNHTWSHGLPPPGEPYEYTVQVLLNNVLVGQVLLTPGPGPTWQGSNSASPLRLNVATANPRLTLRWLNDAYDPFLGYDANFQIDRVTVAP